MKAKQLLAASLGTLFLFSNMASAAGTIGYVSDAKIEMHSAEKLNLDETLSFTTFYKLSTSQEFVATTMNTKNAVVQIYKGAQKIKDLEALNDKGDYELKMSAATFYAGEYQIRIFSKKQTGKPFVQKAAKPFKLVAQSAGGVVVIPEKKETEEEKKEGAAKPITLTGQNLTGQKMHPMTSEKSEIITESQLTVSETGNTLRLKITYLNHQKQVVNGKKPVIKIVEEITGAQKSGYNIYTVSYTTEGNELVVNLENALSGEPLMTSSASYAVYAEYETGFGVKGMSNMVPFAVPTVGNTAEKTEVYASEEAKPEEPQEKKQEPTAAETPIYEENKTSGNTGNTSGSKTTTNPKTTTKKPGRTTKTRSQKKTTGSGTVEDQPAVTPDYAGRTAKKEESNKEPTAAETP